MEQTEVNPRGRLILAAVLAVALIAAVIGFAVIGGEQEVAIADADPECVESWNSDPEAVRLGRHQYFGHDYTSVEVTRLTEDGTAEAEDPEGACARSSSPPRR
ncbi:MAG: hypothetical protein H0W09_08355 [Solirubrobacterales bacterium]|nr:hypothetical protein [Solirubrobacterales bacterium]